MQRALSTRELILRSGLNALSKGGLAGVTLGTLAERVGMSKSGLFAHFRSIEEVQISLLRASAGAAQKVVVAPAMEAPEGLGRLTTLIDNWFGWWKKAGLDGGCPIASALFELDDIENPVRDEVLRLEHQWRGLLTHLVKQTVARGELRPDLDADQFVWELCGIYLSHHVSRRFVRDPEADRRAASAIAELLARSGRVSAARRHASTRATRKSRPKH